MEELVAFVTAYTQGQHVVHNNDGSLKMTPIREALLSDAVLGPKVLVQEAGSSGKSTTFNQIKLVLATAIH